MCHTDQFPMSSCLKMKAVCSHRDVCSIQRLPEVKPCDIRMGFILQSHDQRVGGEEPRADPISHFFYLLSPTVLPGRRHYNVWVKKTLSQRRSEKWHISSGIIALCVSVAHFPFTLTLCCAPMTDSCFTCKGLSLVRSIRRLPELKTWEAERGTGREGGSCSFEKCLPFAFDQKVQLGCIKILSLLWDSETRTRAKTTWCLTFWRGDQNSASCIRCSMVLIDFVFCFLGFFFF